MKEVQESDTRIQQLDLMHYNKISETSIVYRNYCSHDDCARVRRTMSKMLQMVQILCYYKWYDHYVHWLWQEIQSKIEFIVLRL